MDDKQIQDIADRVIAALQQLAPSEPSVWMNIAALTPVAALTAAIVAALVGWHNLKQQQRALKESVKSNARSLSQKSQADARSEWWKRTQWALEAAASDDPRMYAYGAGMLDLLAQSELAGPKDKELLDAVWEGTDTEMQDEDIEQLIRDASEQEDLTYEELQSLMSFGPEDVDALERLKERAKNFSAEDMEKMIRSYGRTEPVAAPKPEAVAAADADEESLLEKMASPESPYGNHEFYVNMREFFRKRRNPTDASSVDDSSAADDNGTDSKEENDGRSQEVRPEA